MNYNQVKKGLDGYSVPEVDRYINYLKFLESDTKDNEKVNWWFPQFTDEQAIGIYKKVAIDKLFIDGESITLQFKKKVIVSYDYNAYKNRVLMVYPESTFDMQLIMEYPNGSKDDFSFLKESGKVIYSHKIKDPFDDNAKIYGVYCIIKNSRGEFLETLNMSTIEQMKKVAKIKTIWDQWFSEMVLKSVIKRACKRHFKDITTNIDNIDNENYDLNNSEKVDFDEAIELKIEKATTFPELKTLFGEKANVKDEVSFMKSLEAKKQKLLSALPEITADDYPKAIKMLQSGKTITNLLYIWKINEDVQQTLCDSAI